MKPDWKDAPQWANWLAMDPDGSWFWFQEKPEWDCSWENPKGGLMLFADSQPSSFKSLERRP